MNIAIIAFLVILVLFFAGLLVYAKIKSDDSYQKGFEDGKNSVINSVKEISNN